VTTDLLTCIKSFSNSEVLEGANAWNCERCQSAQKAVKILQLTKSPDLLFIHLKRIKFTQTGTNFIRQRDDTPVLFPIEQKLSLKKYWSTIGSGQDESDSDGEDS